MVNLALVGVGSWGRNYLHAIQKLSYGRITYIVTRDAQKIKQFKKAYMCVSDYRDLVQFSDLDGVIITTPSSTHYEIADFFLKKNIHMLVEKPLVTSYLDAIRLEKLYKQRDSIVMIGHIYLHSQAFMKCMSLVPSLGKLYYIKLESGNFGPFRKETTALWDWGPHDIAMCLAMVKADPIRVCAWGINVLSKQKKNADIVMIRLDFTRGTPVFISTGRLLPEKKRTCIVVGSKGSILFDDLAEKKLTVHDTLFSRSYPDYSNEEPLRRQLRIFIDAIINKQKQQRDFSLGMQTVQVLHAAEQSLIHNGKTIQIKK